MKNTVRIPKQVFGIIGYPLGHTLSPLLHNWGFEKQGMEAAYTAWPLPEGKVAAFMEAFRLLNIQGLSITIPHKQSVMEHCDHITPEAKAVGAVNTLYWHDSQLWGTNTDVVGFVAPLKARGVNKEKIKSALILGAGGAARAIVAGLQMLGIPDIRIANRTFSRAESLAHEFGITAVAWEERAAHMAELVVNTTPCGMSSIKNTDNSDDASPLSVADFAAARVALGAHVETALLAYDIVYSPLVTPFMRNAQEADWDIQDGLDMFVGQGCEQFRLWTGCELDAHEVRGLLLDALG